MSETIIGTSSEAVESYAQDAQRLFAQVNDHMRELVVRGFHLTYEGPDAYTSFNPGLTAVATAAITGMNESMQDFARALSTVTSNISRSLGGAGITVTVAPPVADLPPAPGTLDDDYRIDVAGFDAFISADIPQTKERVRSLLQANQDRFNAIPRATASQRGWSGSARDHAQNVVVPAQTEQMHVSLETALGKVTTFMEDAKSRAITADASGVAG